MRRQVIRVQREGTLNPFVRAILFPKYSKTMGAKVVGALVIGIILENLLGTLEADAGEPPTVALVVFLCVSLRRKKRAFVIIGITRSRGCKTLCGGTGFALVPLSTSEIVVGGANFGIERDCFLKCSLRIFIVAGGRLGLSTSQIALGAIGGNFQ